MKELYEWVKNNWSWWTRGFIKYQNAAKRMKEQGMGDEEIKQILSDLYRAASFNESD